MLRRYYYPRHPPKRSVPVCSIFHRNKDVIAFTLPVLVLIFRPGILVWNWAKDKRRSAGRVSQNRVSQILTNSNHPTNSNSLTILLHEFPVPNSPLLHPYRTQPTCALFFILIGIYGVRAANVFGTIDYSG